VHKTFRPVCICIAVLCLSAVLSGQGVRVVSLIDDPVKASAVNGPVRIVGARNGVFSGKVIAPYGARASIPRLQGPSSLPPSCITVRYGHPDGPKRYHKSRPIFNGLHPLPPGPIEKSRYYKPYTTQPVWLTAHIPEDAKPGIYKGTWNVSGQRIPVELEIADWRIPDIKDWTTHAGFIQSPDSVAMQYNVPMWSDAHWKLIDKSFELLGEIGNRSLYIPLQRRTHFGNPHSMVHWVRKANNLEPCLDIVEKYIELAAKHIKNLDVVCLYIWEMDGRDASHFPAGMPASKRQKDREVYITVKNGSKLEEATGPKWGSPESPAFWKPVLQGIHGILKKHNLGASLMVGISGDYVPSPEATKDIAAAAPPGTKWVCHAHGGPSTVHGVKAGLTASVWGMGGPKNPDRSTKWKWQKPRYYGWKRSREWLLTAFPRYGCFYGGAVSPFTTQPLAVYRSVAEGAMTACGKAKHSPGCNGFDRMGADFWRVLKSKRGTGKPICGRYPESHWGQLKISTATSAILAPGREGAIATARYEMLREGLQETEARIFIEKALLDTAKRAQLGESAGRIQKMLDQRVKEFIKGTGDKGKNWKKWPGDGRWQKSSMELFKAAAEVARACR